MIVGLVGRLMLLALPLAIGATVLTAAASTVAVPTGSVTDVSSAVTANDMKPAECAGITLTAVVSGSGTFAGATGTVSELITGSAGADDITGNGGDDCILAGGGDDTVNGGDDTDVILGQAGNDTLNGDAGADELFGGTGDDALDGGAGADTCTGGGEPGDTYTSCETQL